MLRYHKINNLITVFFEEETFQIQKGDLRYDKLNFFINNEYSVENEKTEKLREILNFNLKSKNLKVENNNIYFGKKEIPVDPLLVSKFRNNKDLLASLINCINNPDYDKEKTLAIIKEYDESSFFYLVSSPKLVIVLDETIDKCIYNHEENYNKKFSKTPFYISKNSEDMRKIKLISKIGLKKYIKNFDIKDKNITKYIIEKVCNKYYVSLNIKNTCNKMKDIENTFNTDKVFLSFIERAGFDLVNESLDFFNFYYKNKKVKASNNFIKNFENIGTEKMKKLFRSFAILNDLDIIDERIYNDYDKMIEIYDKKIMSSKSSKLKLLKKVPELLKLKNLIFKDFTITYPMTSVEAIKIGNYFGNCFGTILFKKSIETGELLVFNLKNNKNNRIEYCVSVDTINKKISEFEFKPNKKGNKQALNRQNPLRVELEEFIQNHLI